MPNSSEGSVEASSGFAIKTAVSSDALAIPVANGLLKSWTREYKKLLRSSITILPNIYLKRGLGAGGESFFLAIMSSV